VLARHNCYIRLITPTGPVERTDNDFPERMTPVKAKVHVTLKNGVLDPQGKAVQHALGSLGFEGVEDVRQGKFIELDLTETDAAKARAQVEDMCKQLLSNTVIENYDIEIAE
jgi:phosphoribosylformylglycinamidine synthase